MTGGGEIEPRTDLNHPLPGQNRTGLHRIYEKSIGQDQPQAVRLLS